MVTLAVGQANIITHIGNGAMLGVGIGAIKTLIAIPSPILVLTLSFPIDSPAWKPSHCDW
jgi:hypothetical protein